MVVIAVASLAYAITAHDEPAVPAQGGPQATLTAAPTAADEPVVTTSQSDDDYSQLNDATHGPMDTDFQSTVLVTGSSGGTFQEFAVRAVVGLLVVTAIASAVALCLVRSAHRRDRLRLALVVTLASGGAVSVLAIVWFGGISEPLFQLVTIGGVVVGVLHLVSSARDRLAGSDGPPGAG